MNGIAFIGIACIMFLGMLVVGAIGLAIAFRDDGGKHKSAAIPKPLADLPDGQGASDYDYWQPVIVEWTLRSWPMSDNDDSPVGGSNEVG